MSINSIEFLLYIIIGTIFYYLIPRKTRLYYLLIMSLAFYVLWSIPNTILLIISALFTYGIGIRCELPPADELGKAGLIPGGGIRSSDRKKFLILGILLLLGELFVFKYLNFTVLQINAGLKLLKQDASIAPLKIIMPMGISFYVFQSVGYLADVYNGKTKAEKNVLRFLLFITFFPKIIQGPIERSTGFLKQLIDIENRSRFDSRRIQNGMITILWGLFMKMVIADRIGIIVDNVFSKYFVYGTVELFFASVCYTIQIYTDFAGYSAIAVGTAQMFGFDLIRNFDCPYFSASTREFWRRWHISLSQWFRDYVYIPLGGSRCSTFRKRLNIFLVMFISGIWHGAGWNFIAWGLLHGLYQVVEDIITPLISKLDQKWHVPSDSASYKIGNIFITFNLVNLAWIFFRSESIGKAFDYIRLMLTNYDPWVFFNRSLLKLGLDETELNVLTAALVILFIVSLIQYKYKIHLPQMLQNQCLWFRWAVIILLFTMVWVFGEYGPTFNSNNFIYQSF